MKEKIHFENGRLSKVSWKIMLKSIATSVVVFLGLFLIYMLVASIAMQGFVGLTAIIAFLKNGFIVLGVLWAAALIFVYEV